MRLIDADKLMMSLSDWQLQEAPLKVGNQPKEFTAFDMDCMVWRTIRDCESAVEEQPTVKAIPIEWIEQFMNRFRLGMVTSDEYALLHFMLTDWEKENEN